MRMLHMKSECFERVEGKKLMVVYGKRKEEFWRVRRKMNKREKGEVNERTVFQRKDLFYFLSIVRLTTLAKRYVNVTHEK